MNEQLRMLGDEFYKQGLLLDAAKVKQSDITKRIIFILEESFGIEIGTLVKLDAEAIRKNEMFMFCTYDEYAIVSEINILVDTPTVNLFTGSCGLIAWIPFEEIVGLVVDDGD